MPPVPGGAGTCFALRKRAWQEEEMAGGKADVKTFPSLTRHRVSADEPSLLFASCASQWEKSLVSFPGRSNSERKRFTLDLFKMDMNAEFTIVYCRGELKNRQRKNGRCWLVRWYCDDLNTIQTGDSSANREEFRSRLHSQVSS